MNEADRQLVDLITKLVIEALREQGLSRGGASSAASASDIGNVAHASPVHVQPPIGQCTGDYSKFPELAGKLRGQAPASSRGLNADGGEEPPEDFDPRTAGGGRLNAGSIALPNRAEPPEDFAAQADARRSARIVPLTGIVTAKQLQEALDAAADGVAWLSLDAKLTPLANDLARQKKDRVKRVEAAAVGRDSISSAAAGAGAPADEGRAGRSLQSASTDGRVGNSSHGYLWWIDGNCSGVREAVRRQPSGVLRPLAAGPNSSAMSNVIRELARAIKSKQTAGGVLFVPSAARAVVLANRCAAIRAVVATCGEAVEQGIRDVGANVLIIEYPHHGVRAMTAMLERFMQQAPVAPPPVERDLADLHRCG